MPVRAAAQGGVDSLAARDMHCVNRVTPAKGWIEIPSQLLCKQNRLECPSDDTAGGKLEIISPSIHRQNQLECPSDDIAGGKLEIVSASIRHFWKNRNQIARGMQVYLY